MSKLNKKCFLASAAMHALLFLIMLVGPAFLMSRDKMDDLPTLDFIPARLIDEPFTNIPSPSPQPKRPEPQPQPVTIPEPVKPQPVRAPKPQPVVKAPEPEPESKYTKAEDIKPNLRRTKPVTSPTPKPTPPRPDARAAAEAIRTTTSTPVNVPAMSSASREAYANYGQAVKSIYERNWYPPEETSSDDALVQVEIVIAKDGAILSSRITRPSGDRSVDATVEATLRRVTRVPAFPAGATESKRTYTIGFNLKSRRALG